MSTVQKKETSHFIEVSQHYNLWFCKKRSVDMANVFFKSPYPSLYLDSTVSQFFVNRNCLDTCQKQFLCVY